MKILKKSKRLFQILFLWGLQIILFITPQTAFALIDYAACVGLVGEPTSCGHVIVDNDWFVALPCADPVVPYHSKFDDPENGPSINYK